MWRLEGRELLSLKGAGGERFAHFMDDLIRAEAACGGLPQSEIDTQVRANIPDGGVDARVRDSVRDDRSGWLGSPSCWQYKAQEAADISENELRDEINKSESKRLIAEGCAYRLCVVGDLPPQKCAKWEDLLLVEARKITPNPRPPRVVAADKIVAWAARFPFSVAQIRPLPAEIWNLDTWRQNITGVTPEYVPVDKWQITSNRIISFANLNSKGPTAGLTVQGEAGVGKTRLVFETLASLREASALVGYIRDEQVALQIATRLAGVPDARALVVADECSLRARVDISRALAGCRDRVRFIFIDNTAARRSTGEPENWLEEMDAHVVREVLAKNYPRVPSDWRINYATLAGGFIRIAADLCDHHGQIAARGDLSNIPSSINDYVRDRLSTEQWTVMAVLALFPRVGFKDEVSQEIASLSQITELPIEQFKEVVRQVKDSPGFVAQGGRYWYVTPSLVARIGFAEGWRRWVADDPRGFLEKLHPELGRGFLDRLPTHGGKEVAGFVADTFRTWVNERTANDLADSRQVQLLDKVVETDPQLYLARLRYLVEGASPDQLLAIKGDWHDAAWGSRRTLVWLCERLAAFPEFFENAEAILFRLALHETESNIGNNATAIWRQLYRVYLSGTAVPFNDRLDILRHRMREESSQARELLFQGLGGVFDPAPSRMSGPVVVAGRLPPSDWQPTRDGERKCLRSVLNVMEECIDGDQVELRELAVRFAIEHLNSILMRGFLPEARRILKLGIIDQSVRSRIVREVDEFITENSREHEQLNATAREYLASVKAWLEEIQPNDFRGRLRTVFSRPPWDERFRRSNGDLPSDIEQLAKEVYENRKVLIPELSWLATDQAASAEVLGFALASVDKDGRLRRLIFDDAGQNGSSSLVRGYIRGLASVHEEPPTDLVEMMDRLQESQPAITSDLLSYGGDFISAMARARELVGSGLVPAKNFASFVYGVGKRDLTIDEFSWLLEEIVVAAESGDVDSLDAGFRMLSYQIRSEARNKQSSVLDSSRIRDAGWRLLDCSAVNGNPIDARQWSDVLRKLAKDEGARAAHAAAQALADYSRRAAREAEKLLVDLAQVEPAAVMEAFGSALLDPQHGPFLQIPVLHDLVVAIPVATVVDWLKSYGIEAARKLARHLPCPQLDESGKPWVSPVVDFVFREFEEDDATFRNFCTGTHGFESWWGNAADRFLAEADVARKFLTHSRRRIREWADREIANREQMARIEQREFEESFLE